MKHTFKGLLLIFSLLFPALAQAALSPNTVWEVRTTGNDTNGGGFHVGIGATDVSAATDLVVDGTLNTKVTSATHNFVAGDVNKFIRVTAGTGFTLGYYQILSTAANAATLDHSPGATSITGGTYTLYSAIDYSQQAAAQYSVTDGVTAGTTTITSVTANFGTDTPGNLIYVAGGTGSVVGAWYEIASRTNATTIVVDRATGLTAGTGVTLKIGGALATINQLATNMAAGNKAFIKADGTYTTTASVVFANGTNNPHTMVLGYTTTRTDNGKATLQMLTTAGLTGINLTGGGVVLRNITVDANNLTTSTGINVGGVSNYVYNCKVMNYTTAGIVAAGGTMLYNEVTAGSGTPTAGISYTTGLAISNNVHDGVGSGIASTSSGNAFGNIVANQSGATSDGIQVLQGWAINNTVYNSGRNGIANGSSANNWFGVGIRNNILVNNAGYGIEGNNTGIPAAPFWDGNAYYNNTLGQRHNFDDQVNQAQNGVYPYINIFDVTMTGVPFTNAGSGDFSLNNTAGAGASVRGAGLPITFPGGLTTGHPDMGAVQHADPGTITINPNFAY